jgi:hypothetical protein
MKWITAGNKITVFTFTAGPPLLDDDDLYV